MVLVGSRMFLINKVRVYVFMCFWATTFEIEILLGVLVSVEMTLIIGPIGF